MLLRAWNPVVRMWPIWGFRFSRVASAAACKELCDGRDDCVAIEYNGMQQLCELHDAVPTHNATGSRRSGCDPRQTKCLRVACWVPQPPDKGECDRKAFMNHRDHMISPSLLRP